MVAYFLEWLHNIFEYVFMRLTCVNRSGGDTVVDNPKAQSRELKAAVILGLISALAVYLGWLFFFIHTEARIRCADLS